MCEKIYLGYMLSYVGWGLSCAKLQICKEINYNICISTATTIPDSFLDSAACSFCRKGSRLKTCLLTKLDNFQSIWNPSKMTGEINGLRTQQHRHLTACFLQEKVFFWFWQRNYLLRQEKFAQNLHDMYQSLCLMHVILCQVTPAARLIIQKLIFGVEGDVIKASQVFKFFQCE